MLSVAGIFLKNREHRGYLAPRKSFCPFCRAEFTVRRRLGAASRGTHHHRDAKFESTPSFALLSIKILFSCEDFTEKSFAYLINRPPHEHSWQVPVGQCIVKLAIFADFTHFEGVIGG